MTSAAEYLRSSLWAAAWNVVRFKETIGDNATKQMDRSMALFQMIRKELAVYDPSVMEITIR